MSSPARRRGEHSSAGSHPKYDMLAAASITRSAGRGIISATDGRDLSGNRMWVIVAGMAELLLLLGIDRLTALRVTPTGLEATLSEVKAQALEKVGALEDREVAEAARAQILQAKSLAQVEAARAMAVELNVNRVVERVKETIRQKRFSGSKQRKEYNMRGRQIIGWTLNLLGWIIVVVSIPFLLHTIVVTVCGLAINRPVPGWWWSLVGPVGALLNWVLLAVTFMLHLSGPLGYLLYPHIRTTHRHVRGTTLQHHPGQPGRCCRDRRLLTLGYLPARHPSPLRAASHHPGRLQLSERMERLHVATDHDTL